MGSLKVPDIPGDPGNQLPYQEFSPCCLAPICYLIGISHFPDAGGLIGLPSLRGLIFQVLGFLGLPLLTTPPMQPAQSVQFRVSPATGEFLGRSGA